MTAEPAAAPVPDREINLTALRQLRVPFPPEQIGKLPKGGVYLDYVGHADLTARLLDVDPCWSWEPLALDANGLPAVVGGELWIRLTVCGVTRIGVGDGKSNKERIGDALRNAAMRFGAALDLWAKGDRDYGGAHDAPAQQPPPEPPMPDHQRRVLDAMAALSPADREPVLQWAGERSLPHPRRMTEEQAQQVIDYIESPA